MNFSEFSERDDEHRRRSRWEQPTHEDEAKLHSLMEEAGIEKYFDEAVAESTGPGPGQSQGPPQKHQNHGQQNHNQHHQRPNSQAQKQNQNLNKNSNSNPNFSLLGINPLLNMASMGLLPNQLPPMLPGQTHLVHNPTLANVLANLQIPSSTIHHPQDQNYDPSQEEGHVSQYQKLGKVKDEQQSRSLQNQQRHRSPSMSQSHRKSPTPPLIMAEDSLVIKPEEIKTEPPEHLPPMQKELFRRIQEQQIKNEKKLVSH